MSCEDTQLKHNKLPTIKLNSLTPILASSSCTHMRIFVSTPLSMQKASANAVTQGAVMKRRLQRQFSFCRLDWCYTIQLASSLNLNHDAYWEIADVKLNQWRIQRRFMGFARTPLPPPPF